MRITKFRSRGLNGYLDFNLTFNPDITFLIGINGSGKTSVLKAIMGLLSPDLDWLMNASFDYVSIDIEMEKETSRIAAFKKKNSCVVYFINRKKRKMAEITRQNYISMSRRSQESLYEEDGDYINIRESIVDVPLGYEVIDIIRDLPAPIFLGLDRSNITFSKRNPPLRRRSASRRPHATLRSFLDESVMQADYAATNARILANVKRQAKASQLREDMLLTLFMETKQRKIRLPQEKDIKQLEKFRKSLKQAFKVLGLNTERVEATVDPFFTKLIDIGLRLGRAKTISEVFEKNGNSFETEFFEWVEMAPRLALFEQIEKLLSKFNEDELSIFNDTNAYLRIMNEFFDDSGKKLIFADDGRLQLRLSDDQTKDVFVLSSGERQLFVLMTTLMFGDDDKKADILIIDEPELSLHLKWQEMFVSAIAEANPQMQLIFATHSPSIILDNEQKCVDLA